MILYLSQALGSNLLERWFLLCTVYGVQYQPVQVRFVVVYLHQSRLVLVQYKARGTWPERADTKHHTGM